jgi:L,D-transpeptidase catalytic domain/D-alanyl-D-alanine carboxypeptidase
MQVVLQSQVSMVRALGIGTLALMLGAGLGTLFARGVTDEYTAPTIHTSTGESIALQYGTWPALSQSDFFHTVRDGFIAERASFVEANLTAMTITVYKDGAAELTVPIKSKGKEGSWWETPSGLYRAQAKKEKHFSSFGHVYMPWSIPFQGNFFIHGWPYHEDGTPVPEGYSGGCMRLEDVYAKQVYDHIEVGMPILVFEDAQLHADTYTYALQPPVLSAASYLVADLDNNFVLLAGNSTHSQETKVLGALMSVLVASEHQNIEKQVTVDGSMVSGASMIQPGASYSLYDLFFPLLLNGSTDTMGVLAGYFGEKRFTALMQAKAHALGMKQTVFSGVGREVTSKTTSEDVFTLLKYLHTNRPFVLTMSAGKTNFATYGVPTLHTTPTHPFAHKADFVGGATDEIHTSSSATDMSAATMLVFASSTTKQSTGTQDLLSVFSLTFTEKKRTIAFIVLDSRNPVQDTEAMRSYVERMYK